MNWAGVLRGRSRLAWHTMLGHGTRRRWHPALAILLAVTLAGLLGVGLAALFGELDAEGAGPVEAAGALGLVFSAALVGLLVFDLHEAVTTLVADSDLELLRRAPIPGPALFALKLLDALPRTSLLLVVLALPAVLAFDVFYRLPAWAWLLVPVILFALWAIPLGLGILVAVRLLTVVPARHAREALGLLSTVTLFVIWLANSFLIPRIIGTAGTSQTVRSLLEFVPAGHGLSPGAWAARTLGAAATGSVAAALAPAAVLAAAALAVLGLAAWVAGRSLETAQGLVAAGGAGVRARRARRVAAPAAGGRPSFVRTILERDGRLLFRDWTVLGDVATAAILWTLLPIVGAPLYAASAPALARTMLIALTVGLGYEVGARALPFERRGAVWIRLAPVHAARWVAAKYASAAAISIPLTLLAVVGMALGLRLPVLGVVEAAAVAFAALALALAIGLWTGAEFGHVGWKEPRAMLTLPGRILATTLLVLQDAVWLGLAGLAEHHRAKLPPGILLWGPPALAALLVGLPLAATRRSLDERDWEA